MLKEMSSGSESAHSEMSLIQAFESAIANFYSTGQSSEQSTGESEYKRFQQWQQAWKNDPSTLAMPEDDSPVTDITTAAPISNFARASGDDHTHDIMYAASCTPFFGVDGNFASFPQNPEDLSTFFGADFGSGHDFGAG